MKHSETLRIALAKIKAAQLCHPNVVAVLLEEAEERLNELLAEKSPEQSDQILAIAEALRKHGLTLVKTAAGYDVLKLGEITAGDHK